MYVCTYVVCVLLIIHVYQSCDLETKVYVLNLESTRFRFFKVLLFLQGKYLARKHMDRLTKLCQDICSNTTVHSTDLIYTSIDKMT